MNEKQIEIALAKLRTLYKQTKTKKGREAIYFAARALKQGISGALIPLSYGNSDRVSVIQPNKSNDSPKPFNPDALDLKVDDAGNVYTVWHKAIKA